MISNKLFFHGSGAQRCEEGEQSNQNGTNEVNGGCEDVITCVNAVTENDCRKSNEFGKSITTRIYTHSRRLFQRVISTNKSLNVETKYKTTPNIIEYIAAAEGKVLQQTKGALELISEIKSKYPEVFANIVSLKQPKHDIELEIRVRVTIRLLLFIQYRMLIERSARRR